ncbi:MAG: ABC transporter substrate-binding protein [Bacteroidetes bacterium]|nr:ABC transporter substrate-binding protein [Bacteroidota bacterium]
MSIFTDQLNRKIELSSPPKRIISLVPSQTELLYDLGLRDEVIGITKFCIHPDEWFKTKTRIGGTKQIDFEKIKALQPDLIIGNKEENEQKQIELLMKDYNVWMSDIYTLKDAYDMITRVGTLVGKQQEATFLKLRIESGFNQFKQPTTNNEQPTTAYFIWNNPYMVAGRNTFINELLWVCGLKNIFEGRYPEVTGVEITASKPQVILLSSEPYPFKEKHIHELKAICPDAHILIVDGELFSWYGSRLLKSPEYFKQLIEEITSKP